MKILAIETSCDETAAAVIEKSGSEISILSSVIASQIDIHAKFGGVFPEIASRAHTEQIIPVICQSLEISNSQFSISNQFKNSQIKKLTENCKLKNENLLSDTDVIAVTAGPGLIGSLLVGVNSAKTLAYATNKPIMPINHWLGHIYSCFAGKFPIPNSQFPISSHLKKLNENCELKTENLPSFPLLALIVSGGHTGLVLMHSHTEYEQIGQTLDDAAGEAFDKVAKLLDLGYPGGPAIASEAEKYRTECHPERSEGSRDSSLEAQNDKLSIKFPRAMLNREGYDFSFSGLKTSVLNKVRQLTENGKLTTENITPEIAYEFQQCVIDILIGKTLKAAEEFQPKSILLCGGVSANKELREQMSSAILSFRTGSQQDPESRAAGSPMSSTTRLEDDTIKFFTPPMELTGDNAAMIGLAAAYQIENGVKPTTYENVDANSNLKL